MKFAPLVAGGALALLLFTLATAKSIAPPNKSVPLQLAGVETLEVRSGSTLRVTIDSKQAALLHYPDREDSQVRVRRDGSRLIVDGKFEGYAELSVSVPPSVHRFVVSAGSLETSEHLSEVEVLSQDDFSWKGDVDRLLLRDTSDPSAHKDDAKDPDRACGCSSRTFHVSGRIGELRAWSPHANLDLNAPDDVGEVYADLGPLGSVSLEKARRFGHIHIVGAAQTPDSHPQPPEEAK